MAGGTEAFPDLGRHCQLSECKQLDFLPFKCDGCHKVFCVEHRSYKSHECTNSDHNSRKVLVCETCSMSIEIPLNSKGGEAEMGTILEKHHKSGDCDPKKKKKKKPTCGVKRCKEILTFSNTSICKSCQSKFCLKHRFQSDHACETTRMPAVAAAARARVGGGVMPFLAALGLRNGQDCTKKANGSKSAATPSTSVKAY
ncbi:zinc finger AN1 domain-containing stress-associated protein 12 [Rutidosis leptorrhynchoides]|uniref:zinc finger AN1 domain-containing stress-associated protein 12 n=1 Tax=Rutidosis leptorrhynchoides TaxID=125765 RepID=UPI003A99154E